MTTIYVGPQSSGNGSGSSASNALAITSLDQAILLAGPGGTVVLLADRGEYNTSRSINLSHGGTSGAPVTIIGQDSFGNPENVVINGTRPAEYSPTNPAGNTVFRLTSGANDLVFENMSFNNVGTAFVATADIHDIKISNMTANNVQYFLSDYASAPGGTATISGLTVADVDVHGFSKGVIRLQYDTNNVTIQNVFGDSQHQDGDGIAMGIHFTDTVHNVTVTGSTMENAVSTTSSYWNGDGFATEWGVYNVTFQDCVARGNADAGFDIKSSSTTIIDSVSEENSRNFRFWTDASLINSTGLDPHKYGGIGGQAQIWVKNGAHVTVTGGTFADSGSDTRVVSFDNGGSITFTGSAVVHAIGAQLSSGGGTFLLDPSAVREILATGTFSTDSGSLLGGASPTAAPADLTLSANTVAENTADGTSVGFAQMVANSGTTGVTYSLANDAGGCFSINPQTGEITVAKGSAIDFETSSTMKIVVQVANSAGTYQEAFTIAVTDQSEAPTGVTFTGGSLPENSPAGTLVGTVIGVDPDAVDTLTYSLSDDAAGRFTIDPKTGKVLVASGAVLDFETQSKLSITVVVTDSHGLTYSRPLTVSLQDVVEQGDVKLTAQTLNGTSGNDTLTATSDADHLVNGFAGNDQIVTKGGADVVTGGAGNDSISTGGGNDTINMSGTNDGFDSIDGGSGTDVIRATANGTTIGLHSFVGVEKISANGFSNVTIGGDSDANNLDFSSVNLDRISQIHGGGGNDVIIGSAGDNVIFGDAGADRLTGGAGRDTFSYANATHSAVGNPDLITDFMTGVDRIDLSAIDASTRHKGNDAFKFIGTGAFTGQGGLLRVDYSTPGITKIFGDLDGDKIADFEIDLVGSVRLQSSDFGL